MSSSTASSKQPKLASALSVRSFGCKKFSGGASGLIATHTWWGPFGTNSAETVIREAITIKIMRTGSIIRA